MIPITDSLNQVYSDTDNQSIKKFNFIKRSFEDIFKSKPDFYVRAPGRVNLIGEHIDYEGYSVLPMAIAKEIVLAVSIPGDNQDFIQLDNIDTQFPSRRIPIDPNIPIRNEMHDWSNYFRCGYKGAWLLTGDEPQENFTGIPMNVLVYGDIPLASGLSSSSAFVVASTIASIYAQLHVTNKLKSTNITTLKLDAKSIAELCRVAEQYIGTMSGGMDQAISCLAQPGNARLIHFNPIRAESVRLPANMMIVVADSLTKAEKAKSAKTHYNKRVVECMLASKLIALKLGLHEWKTMETLEQVRAEYSHKISLLDMEKLANSVLEKSTYSTLDLIFEFQVEDLYQLFNKSATNTNSVIDVLKYATEFKLNQRARHVYSEAARVFQFKELCAEINNESSSIIATIEQLQKLGDIANSSHRSCRDMYDCSSVELDELTTLCCKLGAFGSRLTGAGWGGSTVSFVLEENVDVFIRELKEKFYSTRIENEEKEYVFACKPMNGASIYVKT